MTVHVDLPTPVPAKYVYDFTEGGRDMADLLGGKGAGLAEMGRLGLTGLGLLERVWLTLTALGYSASLLTQVIEAPQTNGRLREAVHTELHPQILLRVGHAPNTVPTPRLDATDVITVRI